MFHVTSMLFTSVSAKASWLTVCLRFFFFHSFIIFILVHSLRDRMNEDNWDLRGVRRKRKHKKWQADKIPEINTLITFNLFLFKKLIATNITPQMAFYARIGFSHSLSYINKMNVFCMVFDMVLVCLDSLPLIYIFVKVRLLRMTLICFYLNG